MKTVAALTMGVLVMASTHAIAQDSSVYQCTSPSGQTSFGDQPCPESHRQEIRTIDPAPPVPVRDTPAPLETSEPDTPQAPAAPPTVVIQHTPRPLFECTTPEGSRYDSDSGDGNPRWVPLWQPAPQGSVNAGLYANQGTWVRDACRPLPREQACSRLSQRRETIRGRFFQAQQRERDTLRAEENALNTRLTQDCGR